MLERFFVEFEISIFSLNLHLVSFSGYLFLLYVEFCSIVKFYWILFLLITNYLFQSIKSIKDC